MRPAWLGPALAALAIAQLLFWGLAGFLETRAGPAGQVQVARFAGLRADHQPGPAIPDAALAPVQARGDLVLPPGTGHWSLLRTRFRADGRAFGLLTGFGADAYRVYINGAPIGASGGVWPDRRTSGRTPRLFVFEAGQLRQGENRIDIVIHSVAGAPGMRAAMVGPLEDLEQPATWRRLRQAILAGAAGVALWAGVLALLLAGRNPATADNRWLGVMLLAWAGWASMLAFELGLPAAQYWTLYILMGLLVLCSSAAFTAAAVGPARVKPRYFLWAFLASAAVLLPALEINFADAFSSAMLIAEGVSILMFLAMLAMLLRWLPAAPKVGFLETVAVAMAITAGLVDTLDELFVLTPPGFPPYGPSFAYTPYACALLGFAFIWRVARRATEAEAAVGQANQDLSRQVAEKEAELAAGYERQRDLERRRTLADERQRIMRDMHDGIGAQLLGLLLQARSDRLSGEALVSGLEDSVGDLRLVVDSLDQGEASLEAALGAFRARIAPRCEAAGVELVWRIGEVGGGDLGPEGVLQIYRLLQEACANALRHAEAKRITVALTRAPDGQVEISLADDGRGFDAATVTPGRGLRNMRLRAERIGGALAIESGGEGTRVLLRFRA